jgi:hypothetical protein
MNVGRDLEARSFLRQNYKGYRLLSWGSSIIAVICVMIGGCASIRVTDPAETATEQFLQSEAITRCVNQLAVDALRDRRVFVDATYLIAATQPILAQTPTPEQNFMIGELRAKLLLAGVRLVDKKDKAEVILELRSGGIGIDRYDYLLGLPATDLGGVPGVDSATNSGLLVTPQIAILQTTKQKGYAGVAMVAYWADTGELIANSGPFVSVTHREDFWFFGFGPRITGDIPPAQK